MAQFENKQGITKIFFQVSVRNHCPIGNDWYSNSVRVDMRPNRIIPDYDEVQRDIFALDGAELVVEDVVAKVFDIMQAYKPVRLTVSARTEGNGHFPVIVEKEG
jgi:hypothetical protein